MMQRLYRLFVMLVCILGGSSLMAQDIHFSQFYMSPLNLNPALTGVMNCNTRLIANYRNQWSPAVQGDAYNTYAASYDQKIPVGRSDYFGIGGSVWGDVAGEVGFRTNTAKLSLSYSKKLAGTRKKAHYLVIGADGGAWRRGIGGTPKWPSQADEGVWNQALPGEVLDRQNFFFADINAGLLWFSVFDQYTNFYMGVAMSHLNQANQSFYEGDPDLLYTKFTAHSGAQFDLQPKISLLPGFVFFTQGPHREVNFGSSLRFRLGASRLSNQSFQCGLWARIGNQVEGSIHTDALIASARFNYEHFNLGFSYDYTISTYREAAAFNGAFEFSLGYDICGPETRGVYCPKF